MKSRAVVIQSRIIFITIDFKYIPVIPFCTSGSSGIGSSATNLQSLTDNAEWISRQRFSGTASRDEVIEWVNGLGLDIAE